MRNDVAGGFYSSQLQARGNRAHFFLLSIIYKWKDFFMHLLIRTAPSSEEVMNTLNSREWGL